MSLTADARDGTWGTWSVTPYSNDAWFKNPDGTCDHACNAAAYLWLGLAALGGAFDDPSECSDMSLAWGWTRELCTPDALAGGDQPLYELVADSQYALPRCVPNGTYGDEPCYAMASCAAGFALLAAFILNV